MAGYDHEVAARWVPASRRRRGLAIYVDFILFTAVWGVVEYVAHAVFPPLAGIPLWMRVALFGLLEVIAHRVFAWSPGQAFLGIHYRPVEGPEQRAGATGRTLVAMVDASRLVGENLFTILPGVLLINEGAKGLVRWSMWNPPVPFFGMPTDATTSAVIAAVSGLVTIYAGASFLKLRMRGFWIALASLAVECASTVASWNLWDAWVAEMVVRRRAYQGVPLQQEQVERLQSVTPELQLAWFALMLELLVVGGLQLRNHSRSPGGAA